MRRHLKNPEQSTQPWRMAPPCSRLLPVLTALLLAVPAMAEQNGFRREAFETYTQTRSNHLANPRDEKAAAAFAEAAFDWADFADQDDDRAARAEEGIAAARELLLTNPDSASGYFLLGLNLGQLARTKTLGALGLVREMEEVFKKSIQHDPLAHHAGAHRSLGLLYLEAPGWPASIGSDRKARLHLEKAAELAPSHPDNHLCLMEAYLRWEETRDLQRAAERYRKLLPSMKQIYNGPQARHSWSDWDRRWRAIQNALARD